MARLLDSNSGEWNRIALPITVYLIRIYLYTKHSRRHCWQRFLTKWTLLWMSVSYLFCQAWHYRQTVHLDILFFNCKKIKLVKVYMNTYYIYMYVYRYIYTLNLHTMYSTKCVYNLNIFKIVLQNNISFLLDSYGFNKGMKTDGRGHVSF